MKPLSLLLFLFGFLAQAQAQSGGDIGSHTRMGFSARGMGMANTLTSVTDDGIYPHYNPALTASLDSIQVDINSTMMNFNRKLNTFGVGFKLPPTAGIYVGIMHARVGNIDGRTSSGYHTNMLSTNDYQFFTSFGLRPGKKIQFGASFKLNLADYHDEMPLAKAFGIDLGMLVRPSDKLSLALSVQDLLAETIWDTSKLYGTSGSINTANNWPRRINLASSYRFTHKLLLSTEIETRIKTSEYKERTLELDFGYPTMIERTTDLKTKNFILRSGIRYHIHERLTLRTGYQNGDLKHTDQNQRLSLGFSVHLPFDALSPSIDYAFTREPSGISSMHAFALRLNL
jgi:hypothetical protein